jgi:predicted MPP superfamily phosphohydrolase
MNMFLIKSQLENGFQITPQNKDASEFRILQVTDLHLAHVQFGRWRIFNDVKEICKRFNVDLIINTGDFFTNCPQFYIYKIIRDFNNIGYPWAFSWGNHDCENYRPNQWFDRFDKIEQRLHKATNCLYKPSRHYIEHYGSDKIQDDPREFAAYHEFLELAKNNIDMKNNKTKLKRFDGFYGGNYHIQVCNPKTDTPAWELFMMNSRRDHHIPPKALRWMENQMKSHQTKIPALLFYHVPNYELETYWNNNQARGIKGERVCFEKDRGEIHQFFKQLGTIKGCFFGHDHVNDYYIDVDGIRYSYGRKTGNLAYGADWNLKNHFEFGRKKIRPGATLITIKFDGNTPMEQSWDHQSVFSNGETWKADGMEDMGTIKK